MKERYHIYYEKYSILGNRHREQIMIVYTEDIYHEIGRLYCESLENIKNIRYTKQRAPIEEIEKYWIEEGFRKVTQNIWIKE